MSDEQSKPRIQDAPTHIAPAGADWWVIAAALDMLIEDRHTPEGPIRWRKVKLPDGCRRERFVSGEPSGSITITGKDEKAGRSDIHIEVPEGEDAYFHKLNRLLHSFIIDMREIRRAAQPTTDDVIVRYYRSKAQGSRITLRQLADETGYSYEALRKHKQRYDQAGKWGSKKGQSVT